MRTTPAIDALLRDRLEAAVHRFANGSVDKLGRLLGYTNGGYLREVLSGKKPVREAIIERANASPELNGWFNEALMLVPPDTSRRPIDRLRAGLSEAAVEFGAEFDRLNETQQRRLRMLLQVARDGIDPIHIQPAPRGAVRIAAEPAPPWPRVVEDFDSGLGDLTDLPSTPPQSKPRT